MSRLLLLFIASLTTLSIVVEGKADVEINMMTINDYYSCPLCRDNMKLILYNRTSKVIAQEWWTDKTSIINSTRTFVKSIPGPWSTLNQMVLRIEGIGSNFEVALDKISLNKISLFQRRLNETTLRISILAKCGPNFYNRQCSKGCQETKWTYCTSEGEYVCRDGNYTGTYCHERFCLNGGEMTENGCECADDWTGARCNECAWLPGCTVGRCLKGVESCESDVDPSTTTRVPLPANNASRAERLAECPSCASSLSTQPRPDECPPCPGHTAATPSLNTITVLAVGCIAAVALALVAYTKKRAGERYSPHSSVAAAQVLLELSEKE